MRFKFTIVLSIKNNRFKPPSQKIGAMPLPALSNLTSTYYHCWDLYPEFEFCRSDMRVLVRIRWNLSEWTSNWYFARRGSILGYGFGKVHEGKWGD